MTDNSNQKKNLRIYGIFIAIMLLLGAILIGVNYCTRKNWSNGLKSAISGVLKENAPDVWVLGNNIPMNSPFATSASLYELRNKDSAEKYFAIIIRTPTIYGHMPAVFTYNKTKGAEFIGYTNLRGRVKKILESNSTDISINYWIDRIPEIVAKATEGAEK